MRIAVTEISYIARIRKSDGKVQGVFEHNENVASIAYRLGLPYGMGNIARLTGMHHDDGKNTDEYKRYLKAAAVGEAVKRGSVIHSTYGAVFIDRLASNGNIYARLAAELARTAIMSHHGLRDCITEDGKIACCDAERRIAASYAGVENIVNNYYGLESIREDFQKASGEAEAICRKIDAFHQQYPVCGSSNFYLAMYERLLTSILIDADRTDAAYFEDASSILEPPSADKLKDLWRLYAENCRRELEKYKQSKAYSPLDEYRDEISSICAEYDGGESGIFRLVLPCGAGKTLSALRYSLGTAERYAKRHIFYVAPFNSILEQNADEIIKYAGDREAVLIHHSNVVISPDDKEDLKKYSLLTENWAYSPIIATSAVQFLNTLFAGKTSNARRLSALGNSVIIIDEIQALPLKIMKLFNAAMNFLAYFCNSAIVLCSATQPPLEKLDDYKILRPKYIVDKTDKYDEAFGRVEIIPNIRGNGLTYEQAAEHIITQSNDVKSLLAIVNTRQAARYICKHVGDKLKNVANIRLFHLSANMCPAHRSAVISEMVERLSRKDETAKTVCVSTTLIEAGVNVSFERALRSLAGLDGIIQSAGRCNRNREADKGIVEVIFIRDESISRMPYLLKAQEAAREVFFSLESNPQNYLGGALSKNAVDEYYARFISKLNRNELSFPLPNDPEHTIIDLLTAGRKNKCKTNSALLKQAFREAGEAFSVIDDEGEIEVIVEYNSDAKEHIDRLLKSSSLKEQRAELRHLQQYSVRLRKHLLDSLSGGVRFEEETGVFILSHDYYDETFGADNGDGAFFI